MKHDLQIRKALLQLGRGVTHNAVERARSLAPAENEQRGLCAAPRRKREERGTHRYACDFKAAEPASCLLKVHSRVDGEAGHGAVGVAGNHVGLKEHDRYAQQHSGNGSWTRSVASHANHRLCAEAAQNPHGCHDREREVEERAQSRGKADAIQRADVNKVEREVSLGHQSGLNAPRGADECCLMSTPPQLFGDGERRDDVSASASTGKKNLHVSPSAA